jgi:hypothetical protein
MKHGLLSELIVLGTESQERFIELSKELEDEFRPSTAFQRIQVETIAASTWRMRRCWAFEKEAYAYGHQMMAPARITPEPAGFRGFRALADNSHTLDLLLRYETRMERQTMRAYKALVDYDSEKFPNETPMTRSWPSPMMKMRASGSRETYNDGGPGEGRNRYWRAV